MNETKFSITRSFSKKVQIRQYEPEDYYCSSTYYFEEMPTESQKKKISKELWNFCKEEVISAVNEQKKSISRELDSIEAPY